MLLDKKSPTSTTDAALEEMIECILRADDLLARASDLLAQLGPRGGVEKTTGLPVEAVLRMACRRTRWDANDLAAIADMFLQMPATAAALRERVISFSQARAICRAIRRLDAAARATIDRLVGRLAPRMSSAEPETLVHLVDDAVSELRADLAVRREDRAIESSFLVLQPRVDGLGGSLYGEAATESFAAIAEAVEAAAARPVSADDPEAPSRAQQLMDGLVAICEGSLAGASSGTRPRPRLIATLDVAGFAEMGLSEAGRVLATVAGRPMRMTPLSTEILSCDAEMQVVLFDGAAPVGVGNVTATVPDKVRAGLIARDGGCRFPGCSAPAAWCDAHHIVERSKGGDARIGNLALFCRRCHRRIHRFKWDVRLKPDGAMTFRYRGRTYTTFGRARDPLRQ